jgi:DNA-binding CsgD family transcriptional regulator
MATSSPTLDPAELSRLIGLAYEAPFLPSGWRDFAGSAARLLQTRLAMIHRMDHDDLGSSFHIAGGIDDSFNRAFSPRWPAGGDDIYLQAMLDQPAGTIRLSSDIVDPAVAQKTEIHQQLAQPWQLEYFLFASLGSCDGVTSVLSLGRSINDDPFSAADMDLLNQVLLPHLSRSISLHNRLTSMQHNNSVLATMIDMAPFGIVAFEASGRPLLVNQSAATIFARNNRLALRNGKMRTTDAPVQTRLDVALRDSVAQSRGHSGVRPAPVLVPRKGESQPWQVVFAPFSQRRESVDFAGRTACVALIQEQRRGNQSDLLANLVRTWELSKAEARVCEALLSGKSAQETALALHISLNTVKTHLARIFQKTGVHSQTALLQLINTPSSGWT